MIAPHWMCSEPQLTVKQYEPFHFITSRTTRRTFSCSQITVNELQADAPCAPYAASLKAKHLGRGRLCPSSPICAHDSRWKCNQEPEREWAKGILSYHEQKHPLTEWTSARPPNLTQSRSDLLQPRLQAEEPTAGFLPPPQKSSVDHGGDGLPTAG